MNWFRAHRGYIAVVVAVAIVSLALPRYVCPQASVTAHIWPTAAHSSAATLTDFCGPEGCAFLVNGGAVLDPAPPASPPPPLLVAVLFLVVIALALAESGGLLPRRIFSGSRFPPILEFYRLRI